MSKHKYVFNTETLQYEKLERNWKKSILKATGLLVTITICSFALYTAAYTIIPTPKEIAMTRELSQMQYQFSNISTDFENIASQLENLQTKDAEVHRVIFGVDPIDKDIWNGGIGGREDEQYYSNFENSEAVYYTHLTLPTKA